MRKTEPTSGLASMSSVSPTMPFSMGVSTPVGWRELTRMCLEASSLARLRMIPTRPCLEATYGVRKGWPFRPATELIRIIDPPPASTRWGMDATQVFHTPVRLMPMTVSHNWGVTSSHRWIEHTPALATAMSRWPSRDTPSATASVMPTASRTSTAWVTTRAPASSTSLAVIARSSAVAVVYPMSATWSQMSTAITSAPSAASRRAWLRPCPRAAPVTSATLPATRPVARSIGRVAGPVPSAGLLMRLLLS